MAKALRNRMPVRILLLTLLLKTGIKKSEAMGIVPNHIDRSEEDSAHAFHSLRQPAPQV